MRSLSLSTGFGVDKNDKKIKSYNRRIKLANYDGTGEWRDYKSHFDACAAINETSGFL
jgi:hypothetical protein